jgi:hypothetical protein
MKFLCLHGYGTSSEIFEQQFEGIARVLGESHEYIYLDGEVEVTRTGKLYSQPTYPTTHSHTYSAKYLLTYKSRTRWSLSW